MGGLYLALASMTAQQTLATAGRSTVPLIAAAIIADLGIDAALVGVYLAIQSVAGFLTTMACGGFIIRYGALRMTQVGMAALAVCVGIAGATPCAAAESALHAVPDPLLWALPYNYDRVAAYPPGTRVVYDWIDDLEVFPYDRALLQRMHERALASATVVANRFSPRPPPNSTGPFANSPRRTPPPKPSPRLRSARAARFGRSS